MKAAMKRLYEKKYNPMTEIDEGLFNELWDIYNDATDKGFASSPLEREGGEASGAVVGVDDAFYHALRYNNGVFAAFKTHRLQNDMAAQLLDENGKLKSFAQWEADTRDIRDHHVRHWLQTEYDMAVKRAHMAADWQEFERDRDTLPNLEWIKSTSVTPGEDHKPFWGVILPIDDPFWDEHRPGDRWGCKCRLRNTDAAVKRPPKDLYIQPIDKPAPGLDNNPGKDAMLYSFSHPYFALGYMAFKKLAPIVEKFVNKQLNKVVNKQIKKEKQKIDKFDGKLIHNNNFKNGEIIILRRSLDDVLFHAKNDNRIKTWLLLSEELKFKNWKYIGWNYSKGYDRKHPKYDPNNPNKRKHPEADYFLYYEFKIAGKIYYANVKMHNKYNKEVLYTIESNKPEKVLKGEPKK